MTTALKRAAFMLLLSAVVWASPASVTMPQASPETLVYITKTGEKYHKSSCRYLKQSKIEVTLAKAKEMGKTACKVCKPPTE